jgi:NAD(P)-dependent dehydrogenase (short-subunit alcohol dehydrogenase family)
VDQVSHSEPRAGLFRRSGAVDRFDGAVAVVTGAASGIGRSLALLLARGGARVHVVDRDATGAAAVAEQIRSGGGDAVAHEVDVTDAAAVEALAAEVFAAEGRVDLLFNNAGIGHAGPVAETPLSDWRRVVEVNLMGVVHGAAAFVPRLLEQGRPAHIVNTASLAGLLPNPGMVPYSTTKAAVVGLSEALDGELAAQGIRVTALCPGIISTDIVRTSIMRGSFAGERDRLMGVYARRGTSPDVVARDALAAVRRHRVVAPAPRWQVSPVWLVKRWAPGAARAFTRASYRFAGGGGVSREAPAVSPSGRTGRRGDPAG